MKTLVFLFIFGIMITAGFSAQNIPENLPDKYQDALDDLDEENLDSIGEAAKIFREIFAGKQDFNPADQAFREWQTFSDDVLNIESGRIGGSGIDDDILDNAGPDMCHVRAGEGMKKKTRTYLAYLEKKGVYVSAGEDGIGLSMSFDFVRKNFFGIISKALQEFLEMENEEMESGCAEADNPADWETERKWIIKWENYLKVYPESIMKEDAKDILRDHVMTYITGGEEGLQKDLLKKSYENFLNENTDSRYYPLVKEYYDYLAANNFQPDWNKAGQLLDKYNK